MWRCKKCQTENPDSLQDCEKCGARMGGGNSQPTAAPMFQARSVQDDIFKNQAVNIVTQYQREYYRINPKKTYSALAIIPVVLNICGVLNVIGGVIMGIAFGNLEYYFNFWNFLIPVIIGAGMMVFFIAAGQLIKLFLHHQELAYNTAVNTYVTMRIQADMLTKQAQPPLGL